MDTNQGTSSTNNRITLLTVCMLLGAMGTLITLIILALVTHHYTDSSFLNNYFIKNTQGGYAVYFFDKEWDSETYLSIITNFYAFIITIIVALLGVVAAFAFFAIRGASLDKTEEVAEKEVRRFFEKATTEGRIKDFLKEMVEDEVDEKTEKLDTRVTEMGQMLEENGLPYKLKVEDEKKTE